MTNRNCIAVSVVSEIADAVRMPDSTSVAKELDKHKSEEHLDV